MKWVISVRAVCVQKHDNTECEKDEFTKMPELLVNSCKVLDKEVNDDDER